MKFCERCGSILLPARKGNAHYLECRVCRRRVVNKVKAIKFEKKCEPKKKVIIEEKPKLPITIKHCPKCENSKAYFWTQQTGIEDQPPTQFFKCVKCGYVWRGE